MTFLLAQRSNLLRILQLIQSEMENGLMKSFGPDVTVFADWSPDMVHFGSFPLAPEAIKIGSMIDYMAFQQASYLLSETGDMTDASTYAALAVSTKAAIMAAYLDPSTGTFGGRVQTNAMAIYSGIATDAATMESIFQQILSQPPVHPVTPYFNYFVMSAMDKAGHHADAIQLLKTFWGSMLNSGATTFWEMYDPQCVNRADFHSCLTAYSNTLQSVDKRLYVSLSHAWSGGPAAFLSGID
jgi:alpha-L-rhamnosidase